MSGARPRRRVRRASRVDRRGSGARTHAAETAVAGTGAGASTVGTVACCAHHIADLLPFLGLSGTATLLTDWRLPIIGVAIAINAVGIGLTLRRLRELDGAARRDDLACAAS